MHAWIKRLSIAAALLGTLAVPVQAAGPRFESKLPHGGRPLQHVAFPAIRDWSTLKISLRRTMCFGACPSYFVAIAGGGAVTWHGEANVAVVGDRNDTIPAADVKALYRAFRKADFFWLFDSYAAPVTDMPSYVISIAYDGHSKSITDYAGAMIGMPRAVHDLEQLIDKTANTTRWIGPPN